MTNSTCNYNVKFYENPIIADRQINKSGLGNSGNRAVASSIYELYFNTRKASNHNNDFYDPKAKDYYIIFKNSRIQDIKNYTPNAINKAKNILRDVGLIHTVPQNWNQPDKIFLPGFNKIYKSVTNVNDPISQTKDNTSGHSTVQSRNKSISKIIQPNNPINTSNTKKRIKSKTKNIVSKLMIKAMKANLIFHYHLPKLFVDKVALNSCDSYREFKHIVSLLWKAKKAAYNTLVKKHRSKQSLELFGKVSSKRIAKCLSTEENDCYSGKYRNTTKVDSLASQYDRTIQSAKRVLHRVVIKHCIGARKQGIIIDKTIMKCLKNYFVSAGEYEIANTPNSGRPNFSIPVF